MGDKIRPMTFEFSMTEVAKLLLEKLINEGKAAGNTRYWAVANVVEAKTMDASVLTLRLADPQDGKEA